MLKGEKNVKKQKKLYVCKNYYRSVSSCGTFRRRIMMRSTVFYFFFYNFYPHTYNIYFSFGGRYYYDDLYRDTDVKILSGPRRDDVDFFSDFFSCIFFFFLSFYIVSVSPSTRVGGNRNNIVTHAGGTYCNS